jgi:DNA-3-methyladenine glycosylase II
MTTQLIGTLRPIPPYDFGIMLAAIERFPPVMDRVLNGEYWRALHVGEEIALVRVSSRGTADDPYLDVYLVAGTGQVDEATLLHKLRQLLSVDADLNRFYEFAATDAALSNVVLPLRGLHNIRTETVFEALLTLIIEQQITLTGALRAQRWLVEWANNRVIHDDMPFYTFARPHQLAGATVDELKPLKITSRRMQVMIDVAQQEATGQLNLEALGDVTPQAAYERLVKLNGIGHWTAAWTLTRGLGHYYAVGSNDVALQAAVNHYFYGQNGRTTTQVVHDTFTRYEAFAGIAAYYTLIRWVFDRY